MATITKRGPRSYHVRIRRSGHPTLARTFDRREDARQWARDRETEMDRGNLPDTLEARRTTLADALTEYRLKVTPKHKGAAEEASRILAMTKRRICQRSSNFPQLWSLKIPHPLVN
ncbi:MAG: hypothetical protein J5I92_04270 [Thiogranum sp.]|nr:hypothetical protein [Thiogranum sp.]